MTESPQQRIVALWREAERVCKALTSLPPCPLRDKLEARDEKLRKELSDSIFDLLAREPDACVLHAPSRCKKPNKGTDYCLNCLGAAFVLQAGKPKAR